MAVNPHVFVKVKGVYRGPNPGPETEGLTPEEMLVNVEAIESVKHGSPNKHGCRNGVLLTSAGQIDFIEDPKQIGSLFSDSEFKKRYGTHEQGESRLQMPSIGDKSDRTVILGEQRVYMEEPSGGHYTTPSINADSIILMRGNPERPTVYAKDGDGFVKFASQRSMENISEQISLLNSREFYADMNMPRPVEHIDKDLQHSEKFGRRLPDLSGLKSDNPLDKGYQPGDD